MYIIYIYIYILYIFTYAYIYIYRVKYAHLGMLTLYVKVRGVEKVIVKSCRPSQGYETDGALILVSLLSHRYLWVSTCITVYCI